MTKLFKSLSISLVVFICTNDYLLTANGQDTMLSQDDDSWAKFDIFEDETDGKMPDVDDILNPEFKDKNDDGFSVQEKLARRKRRHDNVKVDESDVKSIQDQLDDLTVEQQINQLEDWLIQEEELEERQDQFEALSKKQETENEDKQQLDQIYKDQKQQEEVVEGWEDKKLRQEQLKELAKLRTEIVDQSENIIWEDPEYEMAMAEFTQLKSDVVDEIVFSDFKSLREMLEQDETFQKVRTQVITAMMLICAFAVCCGLIMCKLMQKQWRYLNEQEKTLPTHQRVKQADLTKDEFELTTDVERF